jgi:hypothetical protein
MRTSSSAGPVLAVDEYRLVKGGTFDPSLAFPAALILGLVCETTREP